MKTVTKTTARFNLTQQARRRVALATLICLAFGDAYALPFGEQVQAGNVAFDRGAQFLNINQASQKAIVNWQSFSIAANEAVRLNQPTQGVALFRVVGSDSSQIFGSLTATGSLFLSNPNGVLFGRSAQVDVGSLVATSMRIENDQFLASRYQFYADGNGNVVNNGIIRAEDGGYIALLGSAVENSGSLQANNGSVVLGSAQSAILDMYGDGLVRVKLDGDALNAAIQQTGNITADGGAVQLATHARSAAINVDGIIQANSLVERNGVIRLEGGHHAKVSVNGNLSAAGNQAGSKGGTIEVTGEQTALFKNANLDTSGDAGGGTVLVGGDLQGKNAQVYNARTTYVDQDAKINVEATNSGNGGKAIVWANNTTRFYGNISAKGGANAGNGGFVEVSGKENLEFIGKVDLSASNGVGGKFLLDPTNIILNTTTQASPTNNANGTPDIAFGNAATNIPIAGTTTVQISDITGYSEAFFQATNDITIASTLTMAANNSIRLEAGNNINVNAALTTSGTGNINLRADADNSGVGNLAIGGNITSQVGGISLSAASITRSAGNISANGAANANAGNINIMSTGGTNLGAATVTANGGTASAGNSGRNGGVITINTGGYTGTGAISASGSNGNGANANGGNAGSVSLTSSNGISATAATVINVSGGNAGTGNGNSGNAGIINITNNGAGNITTGALASRVGVAIGTGTGGTAASINITNNASGTLSTGAITTSGNNNSNGNGGNIQLSTTTGNISTGALASSGGTVRTGNAGKNAGTITINSGGSYTGSTIAASGSSALGTSFSGGNAANITINANNGVTTTSIAASGGNATATNGNGGNAGIVALTNNTSGNINTSTITARNGNATGTGTGGSAGAITVNNNALGGMVTTTALSTQGGTLGHGGSINVSSVGDTNINGTINSAGGANLTGNAGKNAGSVSVSSGANVLVGAIASTGSAGLGTNQNGGSGGAVILTAGAGNAITHNSINTSGGARTGTATGGNGGNINVNGSALLSANTTLTSTVGTGGVSSGNITFGGTINSTGANRTLAINTTAATTFNGAIGNTSALASITTNAGGTTAINSGSVTTSGAQTYNDAVTLGATTSLTTTNSAITFANSVNANGNALTMAAGSGNITATNAANNFANVAITSANNVSLRDVNAIQLGTSNIAGTFALQTAGAVTQNGAVTVGGATTITAGAGNDITLNNPANNFNSVAIASGRDVNIVDSNALTINTSLVRTLTARTLSGDLTLGGNVTASGTGSGTSINLVAAQNFINNSNSSLTPGSGRWLVYSNSPLLDTRGAGLLTAYDFKQYNTAFGGTILGAGDGFIYTLAPTITATLGGTASKTYDATTSAPIGLLSLAHSGEIDGDIVTLVPLTSATYDNINAGTGKNVTSNLLNIASASNGAKQVFGYTFSTPTATAAVGTINQRPITVAANPGQNKTFGAADPLPFAFTVGGLGLVGGDTLTGVLSRAVGETVGSYVINQGSLAASANYILSYVGNNFNIFAPSSTSSAGNPRNAAGLVDLNPSLSNYTNPQLFVLNVGATAAGEDSEGQAGCEQDPESLAKDKDFVLMLNYGLNLPKGLNTSCDTTKI